MEKSNKIIGPPLNYKIYLYIFLLLKVMTTSNTTDFINYIINHNSTYIYHQAKLC